MNTATASAPMKGSALTSFRTKFIALIGALGAQSAAVPEVLRQWFALDPKVAVQAMFGLYGLLGIASMLLYNGMRTSTEVTPETATQPLKQSRHTVFRLAALFSLDSFAGGLAVQSLLALWLFQRFELLGGGHAQVGEPSQKGGPISIQTHMAVNRKRR